MRPRELACFSDLNLRGFLFSCRLVQFRQTQMRLRVLRIEFHCRLQFSDCFIFSSRICEDDSKIEMQYRLQ